MCNHLYCLLQNADVKIIDEANPSYGDTPYTYQQGVCGQPSIDDAIFYTTEYIRTSDEITNKETFGSPGTPNKITNLDNKGSDIFI